MPGCPNFRPFDCPPASCYLNSVSECSSILELVLPRSYWLLCSTSQPPSLHTTYCTLNQIIHNNNNWLFIQLVYYVLSNVVCSLCVLHDKCSASVLPFLPCKFFLYLIRVPICKINIHRFSFQNLFKRYVSMLRLSWFFMFLILHSCSPVHLSFHLFIYMPIIFASRNQYDNIMINSFLYRWPDTEIIV